MKVRIRIEQVDNGVVFRWEDLEEIEDPRCLVYTDSEKELSIGQQILDDVKCEMDRSFVNTIEMEINYKPINDEQQPSDDDMKEALRTEYEKGRADVIADTLSWLANCWPQYCDNPNIIDGFKQAIKEE